MNRAVKIINTIFEGEFDTFSNKAGLKFWGNLGVGILVVAKDTGRILVSLRSKYVNEPGTWGVLGGKVDNEDNLNLEQEAKRELKEETRYSGKIKIIPAYVFKAPGGGFEFHNFIGIVPTEFDPVPDWETERFEWLTLKELKILKKRHFGLEALLKDTGSIKIIKKYAK